MTADPTRAAAAALALALLPAPVSAEEVVVFAAASRL